ncbi:MAG: alkaline phosphatase [Spirosomataceae bacterium]
MKRRNFIQQGALAALFSAGTIPDAIAKQAGRAKNIIFIVSDGMSMGTLQMTDLQIRQSEGKPSEWIGWYQDSTVKRALMETYSASSFVTDSAAASSAWGGGVRVPNGSLNTGAKGEKFVPILQKCQKVGKSVGCVTTVQVTHATPAGFCINSASRGGMEEIAEMYLPLRFDVMMGGGLDIFQAEHRKDKKDLLAEFTQQGYEVVTHKSRLNGFKGGKPLLGVFHSDGLPYSVDQAQSKELQEKVPTLAEMTQKALEVLKLNPKGFVLQIESGKVDWAAHANDIAALLGEQRALDEAIGVVKKFIQTHPDTLVILTTDHGNANPGLFSNVENRKFDRIRQFKHTNDWILQGLSLNSSIQQVIERIEYAQGWVATQEQAWSLLENYIHRDEKGLYNPRKLPFDRLATMQRKHTGVGWGSMDHSADYVELAMWGPGSEGLPSFVQNTDLHHLMLMALGIKA